MAYQPYTGGTPGVQQSNAWALLSYLQGANAAKPDNQALPAKAGQGPLSQGAADSWAASNTYQPGDYTFMQGPATPTVGQARMGENYLNTLANANSPANKKSSMSY